MKVYRPGNACEVCGTEGAPLARCRLCNAYVCPECLTSDGLCLVCEEARCYICGEYLSSRACDRCGRLVCEDHGTRIGEATLCDLCREEQATGGEA